MKKLVLAMLVAAMAVPAFAVVNINATDEGNGVLGLWYECTADEIIRGIALRIEADGNATIAGTSAAVVLAVDEIDGKSFGFNTYMDYAFTVESVTAGLYEIDAGHPLAKADERGELDSFPAGLFSVSMGALDQLGEQAGVGESGQLMTIKFDLTADAVISIAVDTLRGGVVGDGFEAEDVTVQASQTLIDGGELEAIKNTAPFYADWVAFGKPNCWAYRYNCRGDADGLAQGSTKTGFTNVGSNDLAVLLAAWQVLEPATGTTPSGPGILSVTNGICADFDRAAQGSTKTGFTRVGSNDLAILLVNWQVLNPATGTTPSGPGLADCSPADYNHYINPTTGLPE